MEHFDYHCLCHVIILCAEHAMMVQTYNTLFSPTFWDFQKCYKLKSRLFVCANAIRRML